MNLKDILSYLGSNDVGCNTELKNIVLDSRQVQPGDLFLGVPGLEDDGRDYIAQALANGAAAVIIEDDYDTDLPAIKVSGLTQQIGHLADYFYNNPSEDINVIGITGTNGKTSCSNYIAQMFAEARLECGVMGTLGNGWLNNLTTSNLTTADSCTVQRQLSKFVEHNTKYVAMEVSSHALAQNRLQGVNISTAVFTNLSQDHLDYHQDMDAYFEAKSRIFYDFAPDNHVINLDCPYGRKLLSEYSGLCYSIYDPTADVYVESNKLYTPWGIGLIINPLIGDFNLSNLLACISVAGLYGIDLDVILAGAKNLTSVPGRMQRVLAKDAPMVVVDYAHTPDALANALQALSEYSNGKLHCIFGCGGDRDRGKRPLMLKAALEYSDHVVITQDNPRTEDPRRIIDDTLSLTERTSKISIIEDRETAIRETILNAHKDDIILIAGKGHEDYQIIGTTRTPFSDIKIAKETLAARSEHAWIV